MDDLVQLLLADLSFSLDRLADELEAERPALARTLRVEAGRTAPLVAAEPARPPLAPRRAALRTLLYRALDEGAVDAARFDRLMLVGTRARPRRRGAQRAQGAAGSPSDSESVASSSCKGGTSPSSGPGGRVAGSPRTPSARR